MEKVYVLLKVEVGSEREVLNALDEIPDIKESYQIHGIYDIIIRVEAETLQEFKDVVYKRIKNIDKIRSTLTMICLKEGDVQVGV
ncbi:unnamed protein product [marine sediment metagenome]|uniref:Transcription regulator AsnC/Lrp ligand binding domain-containing protein n=1 Tax=marine sediment metagenome TaxID=412755 RepID=X1E441_9ZZZZ